MCWAHGTATTAFSHSEGRSTFHGLQFKAEGQEALTVSVSQEALTGRYTSSSWQPHHGMCVCGCGCVAYAADTCIRRQNTVNTSLVNKAVECIDRVYTGNNKKLNQVGARRATATPMVATHSLTGGCSVRHLVSGLPRCRSRLACRPLYTYIMYQYIHNMDMGQQMGYRSLEWN